MTKIKICGLMRTADVEAVNRYLPEYCGFVLSKPFKRYISKDAARNLKNMLDKRIKTVGVFVDCPPDEAAGFAEDGIIDIIQLHGRENERYIQNLKKLTDAPVTKAFAVKSEVDIKQAAETCADFILLDNGTGTGESFDWRLIKDIGREFGIAGGLTPDNVADVIERFKPYFVDVSSGVETDGKKDAVKIKEFIERARALGQEYGEEG